jgi:hypothetical protein
MLNVLFYCCSRLVGGSLFFASKKKPKGEIEDRKSVGNRERKSGTDGTFSDVHVISIVWLLMIGDFQGRGTSRLSPGTPRHPVVDSEPEIVI